MSKEHFYIRTDASPVIGGGHFVRCLNLAKYLVKRGAKVSFLSRNLGHDLISQILAANCQAIDLPSHDTTITQEADNYQSWLGTEEQNDINQCLNLISDKNSFSIIVDHYGVDEEWLGIAKKSCGKLIVLDDLAQRRLDVDIVVNQNLGWRAKDYFHLVGPETKLLIGPQYALLSENYASAGGNLKRDFTNSIPLRVLVSLGGADVENVSGKVARVLEKMQFPLDFEVTIVVGSMNPNLESLQQICRNSSGKIKLLQGKNNLVDAYLSHDLAIGAVGGSSWERCCLGLPTILVPIAENQKPAAKNLDNAGAGILVDCSTDQFEIDLGDAFDKLSNSEVRREVSRRAAGICDGNGGSRVSQQIFNLF